MSSAFPISLVFALSMLPLAALADELRVCADPDNLPFSNRAGAGFENRIAVLLSGALGETLRYVWWSARRGLVSEALDGGACDLIVGYGDGPGVLLAYPPLYRSSYAFVTRPGLPPISSFDDPALSRLRIGVPLNANGASAPPTLALSRRGIVTNTSSYPQPADLDRPDPAGAVVAAVAARAIDVGIAWGPVAGYFGQHAGLVVTPVAEDWDTKAIPLAFDVSVALRLDEGPLRQRVETALAELRPQINALLAAYGVPRRDGVRP